MHNLDTTFESLKRDYEAACQASAAAAATAAARNANALLRRFRSYKGESEWSAILLEAAGDCSAAVALFQLSNGRLQLNGQRGLELPDGLSFDASSARAFASAIETNDVVVAMRTSGEVGPDLAAGAERAFLLPIFNGERVAALLFCALTAETNTDKLEVIAGLAALVLERASNRKAALQIVPPKAAPSVAKAERASGAFPAWTNLGQEQRTLHARAQRFARVRVAEIQLAQPDSARAGREQNDVYLFLKKEIDAARDSFRTQFLNVDAQRPAAVRTMLDYLHLELVRVAVNGDENKLGEDYPGQMA